MEIVERKVLLSVGEHYRTASARVMEPEGEVRVTILYFHRFGGHSLEFVGPAQALVAAGCRVVCLEMLGHPASEWLAPEEYDPTQNIELARSLVADYAKAPFVLIGNDWGAHVALRAAPRNEPNMIGMFLFDYVNSVRFETDIIMPLERAIALIKAESHEAFEAQMSRLAHPLGGIGVLIAAQARSRAHEINGRVGTFVDPAAYKPFCDEPQKIFSSGHLVMSQPCSVMMVNGHLATFKNHQMPTDPDVTFPETLHFISSQRLGYLNWRGEAEGILEFLRARDIVPKTRK
jgi:pimeloyl-ACP methyl ester carboxylesterase